ncbi:Pickpocket protein 28 [Eumeta japonica]|uniref:Pickpocket protein 28 n=1 Tax=Eumeta variegata TaxID=151549 RepID=A0A4C1VEW8_EUMVA|nr:Pickpocket protein 28 [Eumeta japonica]
MLFVLVFSLRGEGDKKANELPRTRVQGGQNESDTRRRRLKSRIAHVFRDFNANTTLHGLKYLSERGLTIFEKVFWLLTFLLSLILCFSLIYNVWYKWQTSPVIVSFSEKMIPVWQSGNFDVKDELFSGRPITDKIDAILEKVEEDRHISPYDIAEDLKIDHEPVLTNLKKPEYPEKVSSYPEKRDT